MPPTDSSTDAAWRSFFENRLAEEIETFVRRYPEERSLYVDVYELHGHDPDFVEWLFDDPAAVLRRGADVLRDDHEQLGRVNLRLRNHPSLLGIGRVRSRHLTKLVTVEGIVDAVGPVEARAEEAAFVCEVCGGGRRERPIEVGLSAPTRCPECALTDTLALEHDRSTFVDVQRVTLRETTESRDSSGPARSMDVSLDDDLVGTVSVGDHLRVTGVVRLDRRGDENRFAFSMDGVAVEEQRPGRTATSEDVPERLKESIRERWESAVDG